MLDQKCGHESSGEYFLALMMNELEILESLLLSRACSLTKRNVGVNGPKENIDK